MSATSTHAPLAVSDSAMARPMPLAAPVTSAALPDRSTEIAISAPPRQKRSATQRWAGRCRSPRRLPAPPYLIGQRRLPSALLHVRTRERFVPLVQEIRLVAVRRK